jgi:hypothetical protein
MSTRGLRLLGTQLALVEVELVTLQDVAVGAAALAGARRNAGQQATCTKGGKSGGSNANGQRLTTGCTK